MRDQRNLRQRVGQEAERAAHRAPPAGGMRGLALDFGERVDHHRGSRVRASRAGRPWWWDRSADEAGKPF